MCKDCVSHRQQVCVVLNKVKTLKYWEYMHLADDESMSSSTVAYKSHFKSFKFNSNSGEMRGLKTNKKTSLELKSSIISGLKTECYEVDSDLLPDDCQNKDVVSNPSKVSSFVAWKDSGNTGNHVAHNSDCPRDSKGSEEGKNLYTRKSIMEYELPELDVFLHESSYQFLKDICIDSGVSSQGKCLVEDCELDHNSISCILNSEVDSNGELTEETLDTASSVSNGSRCSTDKDCNNDVIKQCGSEDLIMEGEVDFDARQDLSDHFTKKIIPRILLPVREAPRKEAGSANSMVSSTTEAIDPSKTYSRSEEEDENITNNLDLANITTSTREESHQCAACQQPPQSGSVSHRSTSSNASSHSFAFPILPAEWTGSPVRMVKADGKQSQKHRRWRLSFPCFKF